MGADTNASPVRTGDGIGPRVAIFDQGIGELIDQMRVRASVATALNE